MVVICIDNEVDGTVEPHLALSALDLHNQVVTLKIVHAALDCITYWERDTYE